MAEDDLAAALLIPAGYGQAAQFDSPRLMVIAKNSGSGGAAQNYIGSIARDVWNAVKTARAVTQGTSSVSFESTLKLALAAWANPSIHIQVRPGAVVAEQPGGMSMAHTSPGMILQFAIAGLLTCAQVILNERKSRSLQRLLTTATRRVHILLGHFLAIFILIFTQFCLLIAFGQLFLEVNYLSAPIATLLVAFTSALCIAALGLFIGVLAKSDEQAIIFSLVPMFVFAGLGGAWTPLEYTSPTFQAIGHLTPVAWAMDGFKNIILRNLGIESVLLPAAALLAYAILFFGLASWRLSRSQMQ